MRPLQLCALFLMFSGILGFNAVAQELPKDSVAPGPPQSSGSQPVPQPSVPPAQDPAATQPPAPGYDKAIFQKPIPPDQLIFLNQFAGLPSRDLFQDKQFRKIMQSVIPDCIFHYGWDMRLPNALELVFKDSPVPVRIRDGRYVMASGGSGPYLAGRGFIWVDLQDGVALGGFYFHPTNGEPTPTLDIFSKQVKADTLKMSQLPPAFTEDLVRWSGESRVSPITTRYFITSSNKKILLEHDEDYCAPVAGIAGVSGTDCVQMNMAAADIDLSAAYYLEQTNHVTNATAWMIVGSDQVAWLQVRDNGCRSGPDPLRCRIRVTRERTHVIVGRSLVVHSTHR
jgi:uncharacterized protein YecT (DUF1311 family)